MKRTIISSVIVVATLTATAIPKLVWLNPIHDFGTFNEEAGAVSCVFKAVNTGDEPVVVIDARANCGCTRPTYPRQPIAPGDTLTVSVAYDPSGRPGRFSKQVKVTTNAELPTTVLSIRGTVIGSSNTLRSRYPEEVGSVRISNRISLFGETKKGRVLAAAINIYNTTTDTIAPGIGRKPEYINVLFRPEVIPPGEQGTLSMTAYTDRIDGWGLIEDSLELIPDKVQPEIMATISTVMTVNEDFSKLTEKQLAEAPTARLSMTTADFGRIDANANGESKITRTITLTNTGRESLIIRRIHTSEKSIDVTISAKKIKPGDSATITIACNPTALAGSGEKMLNARITLITNAPSVPSQTIRAVGEIEK